MPLYCSRRLENSRCSRETGPESSAPLNISSCSNWSEIAPIAARALCSALLELATKLRQGSEVPFARCLAALAATDAGENVGEEVDRCLESLGMTDAKHRLAYALLRAANADLKHRGHERARSRGEEALRLAEILERPTEIVMARVVMIRCALMRGALKEVEEHAEFLRQTNLNLIAAHVKEAAQQELAAIQQAQSITARPSHSRRKLARS